MDAEQIRLGSNPAVVALWPQTTDFAMDPWIADRLQARPALAVSLEQPDPADLQELLAPRRGPCLSLYLPAHRFGTGPMQARGCLKSLVREARRRLAAKGFDAAVSDSLVTAAAGLLDSPIFWFHSGNGMVVFLAPGFLRAFALPVAPAERAAVGDRFTLRPMVAALASDAQFHVLSLSAGRARLLEVGLRGCRQVDAPRMPASLDEALGYAVVRHELRWQGGADHAEDQLAAYFRQVAQGLAEALPDRDSPLVLAALAEHIPVFEKVGSDLAPLAGVVAGDPDRWRDEDLGRAARLVLGPPAAGPRERALARWQGGAESSEDVADIVAAADCGRVEVLFLAVDAECRGCYDPETGAVLVHEKARPGDVDLLESALQDTLSHDGAVYILPPDLMPQGLAAAALLRF